MGSVILFLIIALLIKKGMVDGKGFSDVAKVFGGIAVFLLIVSLLMSPLFWGLLGLAVVALVVGIITFTARFSGAKRSEMYGWDSAEYEAKYGEAVQMFKEMYKNQRDPVKFSQMNSTERKVQELKEEKEAREAAGKYVDEQFTQMYGTDKTANEARRGVRRTPRSNVQSAPGPMNTQTVPGQRTNSAAGPAGVPVPGQAPYRPGAAPGVASQPAAGSAAAAAARAAQSRAAANARRMQERALKSAILPKSSSKRSKIVRKFNEQHNLFLTEEQIKRIVDASYMSVAWKNEVESMSMKYDSVYQWLTGDTAYLRAYLRAFGVQDITSDFRQQMQIVMDSFEEIFVYSDTISGLSLERRIEMINSKFLTNFDDITYMIAYRYLESLGLHHELGQTQLSRLDSELDDLMAKYDHMSTDDLIAKYDAMSDEAVDAELAGAKPGAGTATGGGVAQGGG